MAKQHPIPKTIWTNPIHFLAFGFGAGVSPIMPGTCGTLVAIPIYYLLMQGPLWLYAAILLFAAIIGVWICGIAARDTGVHDHPGIVWDEIVGYLLTMILVPLTWYWILIGFGLFRLFDILKPWPIRWVDSKVSGGVGIMLDDIIAGFFAWVVMQGLVYAVYFLNAPY